MAAVISGELHYIFLASRYNEVFYDEAKEVAEKILFGKLTENGIEPTHIECQGSVLLIETRLNPSKSPNDIANIIRKCGRPIIEELKRINNNKMQHLLQERFYVSTERPSMTAILDFAREM